jgi:CubicO group peptidase (beta-lactamase class C family)
LTERVGPSGAGIVGSLTKQFTATAIMMLNERGDLSLDAPLETYLPEFPARGHRITVRHLLNHTSGLRNYTSDPNDFREAARRIRRSPISLRGSRRCRSISSPASAARTTTPDTCCSARASSVSVE